MNYEPTFTCTHERRVGGLGDGPKWLCDPHRIQQQDSCLVYSVGSNNNFMFEEAILSTISDKCEIHTFDHTVGLNPSNKPSAVHFHPWGLKQQDSGQFKSFPTIVRELGHKHRVIDILKIDCEGCEWETYASWFTDTDVYIRQIQVELHQGTGYQAGYTGSGNDLRATHFLACLKQLGYVVFHKESNSMAGGGLIEYAFLRLDISFQHVTDGKNLNI